MRLVKTLLVFAAGIMAGGLIFGFSGPATSQAGGKAPRDLFELVNNVSNVSVPGGYKQYFSMRGNYKSKYQVIRLGSMSGDTSFVVYVADR